MATLSPIGIEHLIIDALSEAQENGIPAAEHIAELRTFDAAGMMTRERGVVIRLTDGMEYRIRIGDPVPS